MNRLFRPAWTAGRQSLRFNSRTLTRRLESTQPTPPTTKQSARVARIESRLPKFLRRFVEPLRNAPFSHISAFLILHEITAVVPLLGLAAVFHYTNWLPPFISEGKWFSDGVQKFGNYMRKKGWLSGETRSGKWFGKGEKGTRLIAELATAYAITKLLIPLRLIVSVWATPWFATRTMLPVTNFLSKRLRPVTNFMSKLLWRKKAVTASSGAAAGTGATGAGVVPKK